MDDKKGIRSGPRWYCFRYQKLRMPIAWLGGALLFATSHTSESGFRIGVPVSMAGMLLRSWASGYIEKKSVKLATDGPFAHVRNPLYIGNFLIGLGLVVIVQNLCTAAIFLIGFGVLYYRTIRKEEKHLADYIGEPYRCYCLAVPRLLPRITPYPGRERTSFRWRLLLKHRELETLFGLLLVIVGLYLQEEIFREGEFGAKEKAAMGFGVALIAGLLFERVLRTYGNDKG